MMPKNWKIVDNFGVVWSYHAAINCYMESRMLQKSINAGGIDSGVICLIFVHDFVVKKMNILPLSCCMCSCMGSWCS